MSESPAAALATGYMAATQPTSGAEADNKEERGDGRNGGYEWPVISDAVPEKAEGGGETSAVGQRLSPGNTALVPGSTGRAAPSIDAGFQKTDYIRTGSAGHLDRTKSELAVVDWTPSGSASGAAADKVPPTSLGLLELENVREAALLQGLRQRDAAGSSPSSRSSSEATHSDSETDAAETYVSRARHSSQGAPKVPTGKRQSPLPKREASAEKKRRTSSSTDARRRQSDDESDAVAALEQIKNAGACQAITAAAKPPGPGGLAAGVGSSAAPAISAEAPRFPTGALQVLARLVQQHAAPPAAMPSPFQAPPRSPTGQPAPPPLSAIDVMRTCFSETSADRLIGRIKVPQPLKEAPTQAPAAPLREQLAISRNQSIVANSTSLQGSDEAKFSSSFAPVKGRAASGPLPAGPSAAFPTQQSDTATDTVFTIGSVLGHSAKALSSAFGEQASVDLLRPLQALPRADLGAFGSIISSAIDGQLRKKLSGAVEEGDGCQVGPAEASAAPTPRKHAQRGPSEPTRAGSGSQDLSKPPTSLAAPREFGSQHSASPQPSVPGPDPRILEWVLGHRSLTDRGKQAAPKPGGSAVPAFDTLFSRGSTAIGPSAAAQQPFRPEAESSFQQATAAGNTLRRPKAIRASEMQSNSVTDAMQSRSRSDAVLESLFSRTQQAQQPPPPPPQVASNSPPPDPAALTLGDLALAAQHTLSSCDVRRVMQWAGTELAIRDRKVREADKLRETERHEHDAAMTAVGTEVARLKRGQAELAITHYKLQEALAQKELELREKCKLAQQLWAGITGITEQGINAAKEAQLFRTKCEVLEQSLRSRDAQTLAELEALELAVASGNAASAKSLLAAWKAQLAAPHRDGRRPALPPTSRQ